MYITFNDFLYENEENLPESLVKLKEKAKKFKNPKFFAKSRDGGIYFHTTWNEIVSKIKIFQNQGLSPEKISKKLEEYDVYGTKKPQSITSLLNKEYNFPSEIPEEVYEYIIKNSGLLTDNATDAVRWGRILGTENEDRYEDDEITIYRAVDNRNYNEIRPGDWVTIEEQYAIDHNNRYFNGKGKVISEIVNGKDVLVSPTGDYEEAIYAPLKFSKPFEYYK